MAGEIKLYRKMQAARRFASIARYAPTRLAARTVSSTGPLADKIPASPFDNALEKHIHSASEPFPRTYADYPNESLLFLSVNGDASAASERLIRDIMVVNQIVRVDADPIFDQILGDARKGLGMAKLPYRIGIVAALVAGFGSFPMCFDLHTTLWFNDGYVTSDVPEAKDLETWLEVGTWSWGWMEPPLGQLSFFLLCIQFMREQMMSIGMTPYTEWLQEKRANKLISKYPEYSPLILQEVSKAHFSK